MEKCFGNQFKVQAELGYDFSLWKKSDNFVVWKSNKMIAL